MTATIRIRRAGAQDLNLLLESELVLGRDCEGLLLADPQVSRRHLCLTPVPEGVRIEDLGSTNGTHLDSVPLRGARVVRGDASVLVGDTRIEIRHGPPGGQAALDAGRVTNLRAPDDLRATSIDLVADMVSSGILDIQPEIDDGETITIVFSDIESSTERATAMGDAAWFELLEEHNSLFREELRRFRGQEIKSIGDGFMLTFPSVRRALRFAAGVQRRVEAEDGPDLRVRMGMHTGEAIADGTGDLFGRHVNLAARVANLAAGGEIYTSLVVREIASGRDDVVFGPASAVELKGFAELQTVYEVDWRESSL